MHRRGHSVSLNTHSKQMPNDSRFPITQQFSSFLHKHVDFLIFILFWPHQSAERKEETRISVLLNTQEVTDWFRNVHNLKILIERTKNDNLKLDL